MSERGTPGTTGAGADTAPIDPEQSLVPIVALLQTAGHDFSLYKSPTLLRRIERRMAMAAIDPPDHQAYLRLLQGSRAEIDLLARDLLINVTGFFRDPDVFERLQHELISVLRESGREPRLRIWIAGCSTGEEAYSIAIIAREAIEATQRPVKLQIFASDIDAEAVAIAREGYYPAAAAADIGEERLARHFVRDGDGYRVTAALRALLVFTVQDVLTDPPFSRLDLVSCRNLLIYLGPEAQTKALGLFHFALRGGGLLLLGAAESAGSSEERFTIVSKAHRLYSRTGPDRPNELDYAGMLRGDLRLPDAAQKPRPVSRENALASLGQRVVLTAYAPASVLTDAARDIVYSLGPIERYLQVATGHATQNLLAMVPARLRSGLASAMQKARPGQAPIVLRNIARDNGQPFRVEVHAVANQDEELLVVCFLDEAVASPPAAAQSPLEPEDATRINELERELESARIELSSALRNFEGTIEEHQSINEEFQSANEELLTSKEELQSLNEELTALNSQLQESLARQRTTSDDLQNVLFSTDIATVFLDPELKIRLFTPATRALFSVIPTDVGRPLADLKALAPDDALLDDAAAVLETHEMREREVQTPDGRWFNRRAMPYRSHAGEIGGVVLTFSDVTERRNAADALDDAKRRAEQADQAKSRFLAAASHDLRQPLQSIALLQGLLEQSVSDERSAKLVDRLGRTLSGVTSMLNTLLDINQIESGLVQPKIELFALNELFERLREEFAYHAEARAITLRIRSCDFFVASDPQLLEQMLRNLISNALKYTTRGKVLIGCRRRGARVHIEVWDTGLGIAEEHLSLIFEEYAQIDNQARERGRGLGLGLSIVQRLATLLGHKVDVRSREGKGSVFTLDIPLPRADETQSAAKLPAREPGQAAHARASTILLVEDDPEVRELLQLHMASEGHMVEIANDGPSAVTRLETGPVQPDLIITDHNLPNGWSGTEVAERARELVRRPVPVIVLTGDISNGATAAIARLDVVHLRKPVRLRELSVAIDRALTTAASARKAHSDGAPLVIIVDDDAHVRTVLRNVVEDDGRSVETFASAEELLKRPPVDANACLLVDAALPGMSGLDLLKQLKLAGVLAPAIVMTGHSDVAIAVEAMQAGAADFVEKPINRADLLFSIDRALDRTGDQRAALAWKQKAAAALASLTPREQQVLEQIIAGHANKNIAANLGISQRTVENHRAAVMTKTGSKSIPALARLVFAASVQDGAS